MPIKKNIEKFFATVVQSEIARVLYLLLLIWCIWIDYYVTESAGFIKSTFSEKNLINKWKRKIKNVHEKPSPSSLLFEPLKSMQNQSVNLKQDLRFPNTKYGCQTIYFILIELILQEIASSTKIHTYKFDYTVAFLFGSNKTVLIAL